MVQHWTPLSQVQRFGDEFFFFDRGKRIAIIREVKIGVRGHKLWRAVTYAERSEDRSLLGYSPSLAMCAEIVWTEWVRQNPPITDRK